MDRASVVTLGEIADFRNGVNFSRDDEGRGMPIVKVKDFGALHFLPVNELDELDSSRIAVSEGQLLQAGDILIIRSNGNRELLGRSLIFQGAPKAITFSGFCIRARINKQRAVPEFIHYWLRSPQTRARITQEGTGTGINNLSQGLLSGLQLQLPPIQEQRQIARILGALDDKIELNRRMNVTLEAMAQAIFRDWFVDFGPTRRKLAFAGANGAGPKRAGIPDPVEIMGGLVTDPARASTLAALFPAALGDDGLPVGWESKRVADIAARVAMGPFGSNITKDNFVASGVPVIRGKNLAAGFIDEDFVFLTPSKAASLATSAANPGDIVFTHRGTLGQVGRIYKGARHPTYVASQSQLVLSVDANLASPIAVYQYFKSDEGQRAWLANAGGSGVPAISRPTSSLKEIRFVIPTVGISKEFEQIALVLEERYVASVSETRTLTAIRDLLLPKLMSGEIRLRDAEQFLGGAA